MLLATAIMLATTIFAWITLSDKAKVKDFIVPVGVESATLTFQMKKNDDIDYEYVRTFEQISKVIGNSLPNDKYYFRLSVKNNNQIPEQITVKLHNIKNKNTNEGYNMLDIFFFMGGKTTLTIMNEFNVIVSQDEFLFEYLSDEIIEKHDQELELSRFSNIMANNSITLTNNLSIPANYTAYIDFIISYDYKTSHYQYQAGSFEIESIYIFF